MRNPTPGRARYTTARQAAQAAFEAKATAAGHEPRARTADVGDGTTWTQYACGCNRYRSPITSRAKARQGWVSHARMVLANPGGRAAA